MGFWILAVTAALITIAILGYVLVTGQTDAAATAEYDIQVYRDQLKELERDVARGVIAAEEAERAKVEISRRLLEADRKAQAGEAQHNAPTGLTWAVIGLTAAFILGGGAFLYLDMGAPGYWDMPLQGRIEAARTARETRPSQKDAEAGMPAWAGPPAEAPQDYLDLVDQLRAAVGERPNDLQGQLLLASHETALGNYLAAEAAMQQVLKLKGDTATADDHSQYVDLLVMAAGGYVSPEAEAEIDIALGLNPGDPVAHYYAGLMYAQTGRPDLAFRVWRDLLESSDPAAPWVAPIQSQIEQLAAMAGVNYTPPARAPMAGGPSAADMAAAGEMTPEERAAMIEGMVNRLEERLASEGGPAADWAKLINALSVQGNAAHAAEIWAEARNVFADHADDLSLIDQAAAAAGLSEPAAQAAAPAERGGESPAGVLSEDERIQLDGRATALSDELATVGGPPEKWAELIAVLGRLDEPLRAKSVWDEAQKAFAGDPAALQILRETAMAAGVPE